LNVDAFGGWRDTEGMPNRSSKKRPRDLNALAASIVAEATGDAPVEEPSTKNPAAVALGRLGGKKGGKARAEKLSPKKRSEIAKKAAAARWKSRES
jgi:hypothetical protein